MKVRLTEKRELIIEPENATESLALRYWMDGFNPKITEGCDSKLQVVGFVQATEAKDG